MTGDGVNDVLALKEADCSIAMASGSEVACQVSNLVLLDSNFAAMPKVVAEGRRVINNIERTAALFLVKNMFSMLLALISIFAIFSYPISPAQLSYVSTLTIGLPAFILALQPNTGIVKGKFLRNVLYRAVPAAVTNIFVVVFVLLFAYAFKIPDHHMSTTATLLMCVVGLMMLVRSCKPFNLLRIIICSVMTILSVLVFAFARSVFSLSPLPMGCWLIFIIMAMLVYPVMEIISKGLDSTKFGLEKLWEKFLGLFNKEKDDEL